MKESAAGRRRPATGTYAHVGRAPPEAGPDRNRTGYFKPLPPSGRLSGWWMRMGLALGRGTGRAVRDDHVYLLIVAAAVGVSSGLTAGLLILWIDRANELFGMAEEAGRFFGLIAILVPTLGGVAAGLLRVISARYELAPDVGVPEVMGAVSREGAELRGRNALALGLGTGLSIGSGASIGHEGPTVAISASVGSVISRFLGLRLRRQIAMVGAGTAAGLAAAFNAPLAGVIFTVEVIFRRSVGGNVGTMSIFAPLVVAAVVGTFTSHAVFGPRYEFVVPEQGTASFVELIFYLLLAVLAGLLGPQLGRSVRSSTRLFDRLPGPLWIRPALGGAGVGLLAWGVFPELLGPGREVVYQALSSGLVWTTALALLAFKILATSLSIGSGGFGGLFMPSLFIGACAGSLVAELAGLTLGADAGPPMAYAIVGMGAMLAATLRAPLTPIVMIFELTHDYGLILPLMFVCILSSFVATRSKQESYFEEILRERGIRRHEEGEETFNRGRVSELMVVPDHMLRVDAPIEEVQRAALMERFSTYYLVDEEERVQGMLDLRELAARALRGELPQGARAGELGAKDLPTLLLPDDTLAGSMMAFARAHCDPLPVVDEKTRRLIGLLHRDDLLGRYNERVLQRQDFALQVQPMRGGGSAEVTLGEGTAFERRVVGRRWAGNRLKDLRVRERTGVTVVEWRRGDQVLDVDPDALLRENDHLAVVGPREGLLKLRWLDSMESPSRADGPPAGSEGSIKSSSD